MRHSVTSTRYPYPVPTPHTPHPTRTPLPQVHHDRSHTQYGCGRGYMPYTAGSQRPYSVHQASFGLKNTGVAKQLIPATVPTVALLINNVNIPAPGAHLRVNWHKRVNVLIKQCKRH